MNEGRPATRAAAAQAAVRVLSVSELVALVREALEPRFASVWVAGEVSNLRNPPSGHLYFTLKDDRSQIAVVMFRSANRHLRFQLRDGLEIIVGGRVGIYSDRGALQLYAESVEPRGVGALRLAFEQLHRRLEAEGLFAPERKRRIPLLPLVVGVVTARRGAAVRDIITTLRRRWPPIRIVLRPVRVQGDGAAEEIASAIADLNRFGGIDVLIVGRGGGSIEDLWAFNEEVVVRAVADSRIPVISAVGHEIDVTLCDLAADLRAATPTAAAVHAVPDAAEERARLGAYRTRLEAATVRRLELERQRLAALERRLREPREVLATQRLRIDELAERAGRAITHHLRLARAALARHAGRLDALSPLGVLDRGYAIVRTVPEGVIVRSVSQLTEGDPLHVRFAQGESRVVVEEILRGEFGRGVGMRDGRAASKGGSGGVHEN